MLWPFFTKQNPCPACGHWDWSCRAGDRKFICMRVASDFPSNTSDGGWFHDYGGNRISDRQLRSHNNGSRYVLREPEKLLFQWENRFCQNARGIFSEKLNVGGWSLRELGCVFCSELIWSYKPQIEHRAGFGFPMRDGKGKVTGIRLRDWNGNKKAVYGSLGGCFYSESPEALELLDQHRMAFVTEGPTDTAAALTLGFFPIGKPNCNTCDEIVIEVLRRFKVSRVVIITNNDEIKKSGDRPGIEGAKKLKAKLHVPSIIWMPPSPLKDLREFVREGGSAQLIQDDITNSIWTK